MSRKITEDEMYEILRSIVDITVNEYGNVKWILDPNGFEFTCRKCFSLGGTIATYSCKSDSIIDIRISSVPGRTSNLTLWNMPSIFDGNVMYTFDKPTSHRFDNFFQQVRNIVSL